MTGRFGPGNNANPNGHGRPCSLTTILRRILETRLNPRDKSEAARTRAHVFVESVLDLAESGNAACAKEVWDRAEGKVPERIEAKLGGNWESLYEDADAAAASKDEDEDEDDDDAPVGADGAGK